MEDGDICLNISAEPVSRKKEKRTVVVPEHSIKKGKGPALQQRKNADALNKSTFSQGANAKKIRQKDLSAVISKKVKENGTLANKKLVVQKETKQKLNVNGSLSASNKQSEKNADNEVLNDPDNPIVSFTKVSSENIGKTMARKRSISKMGKKSLSDIFSKSMQSRAESKLLLGNQDSVAEEDEVPVKKFKIGNDESDSQKYKQELSFKNKKSSKYKEKIKNKDSSGGEERPVHKPTGKIASLFGNNPEIPHIGQRLVKPLTEPLFTGTNFSDLNIHPYTIANLEQNMQITKMTAVQQKAIPQILSGKDVLIRSQTGSGKTLAYALPIVELLHKVRPELSRNSGLRALVVVPTRELALQTYECFVKLTKPFTRIVPGYLMGGEKRKAEKARLRKGCNILIATPGRLLDHMNHTAALKLNDVKYFVLDEADRMFDMGYEKDISGIVSALKVSESNNDSGYDPMKILRQNVKKVFTDEDVDRIEENIVNAGNSDAEDTAENDSKHSTKPNNSSESSNTVENRMDETDPSSRRQSILLSATLTQAVEKLAGLTMRNPVFVDAVKENLITSGGSMSEINEDFIVPQSVVQSFVVTPPKLRMATLSAYIAGKCQGSGEHKIIIFMATQDMVDYHTEILSSVLTKPSDEDDEDSDPLVDVEFFKLYGNMTQKERTEVFRTFRQSKSGVLLCTDVAARGLDLPKVDTVIQYTGPTSARDYVHRIGRTARAGSSGSAVIFLTPPEIQFVRMLESRRIRIKQEDMDDVLDKLLGPLSKHNSVQAAAIALQNEFETLVLEDKNLRNKAYKAYVSWIRFYSSYPLEMREFFNRKQVHLGHYAKSFALRDSPKRIGGIGKRLKQEEPKPQHNNRLANERRDDGVPQKKERSQDGEKNRELLKKVRMLNTSEYGSGLEPLKKPKKS